MKMNLPQALAETRVSEFRYFDSISSTNDEALRWIADGAPDLALVIAEEQTQGRGRFDRRWVTRPETSLAFSLILTSTFTEAHNIPLYAPLGGSRRTGSSKKHVRSGCPHQVAERRPAQRQKVLRDPGRSRMAGHGSAGCGDGDRN